MKNKLKEILNDYYIDLVKSIKIIKKNIKRVYRLLRFYWNNPKTKIGKEIRDFFNRIFTILSTYFNRIKNYLLSRENRNKNLITIGILIISLLITLILIPSYAIYQNKYSFLLINNIVGDSYASQFDVNLLIYIKDPEDCFRYNLVNKIPTYGYKYEKYNCENDSVLTYNEETKKASFSTDKKDTCRIYFNLIGDPDISINLMLEDDIDSNNYFITKNIPYYGYKYSHYECENNSTINYDSNLHSINVESKMLDTCTLYFQKQAKDLDVLLYVENTYNKEDYELKESIPTDIKYNINESISTCINNNEVVDAEISYNEGYIEINNTTAISCKIYLDIANE